MCIRDTHLVELFVAAVVVNLQIRKLSPTLVGVRERNERRFSAQVCGDGTLGRGGGDKNTVSPVNHASHMVVLERRRGKT